MVFMCPQFGCPSSIWPTGRGILSARQSPWSALTGIALICCMEWEEPKTALERRTGQASTLVAFFLRVRQASSPFSSSSEALKGRTSLLSSW